MGAPKGNQFWKQRSKHGRDKLFATPELLWEASCEYFEWADSNPWILKKERTRSSPTSGVSSEDESTPTARPYSLSALCIYLDCSESYFRVFKLNKDKCTKDFLTVITRIEQIVETQQFEGASVGAFNANIIARKLGLTDRNDITSAGDRISLTIEVEDNAIKNEINKLV